LSAYEQDFVDEWHNRSNSDPCGAFVATCSEASNRVVSSQTNDKNGPITVSHPVSSSGSCSSSVAGHAGQGSPSILSNNAFHGPGASSCSSASVSHAGFERDNGQNSGVGSCSASSHSP